jgi:hypothetical protein
VASNNWCTSVKSGRDDLTDVKTIANFLNIHLGIKDDIVSKERNKRKSFKDMTGE